MKFFDTHFDDYIASNKKCSLHPKINKLYESFPSKIDNLKNIISTESENPKIKYDNNLITQLSNDDK